MGENYRIYDSDPVEAVGGNDESLFHSTGRKLAGNAEEPMRSIRQCAFSSLSALRTEGGNMPESNGDRRSEPEDVFTIPGRALCGELIPPTYDPSTGATAANNVSPFGDHESGTNAPRMQPPMRQVPPPGTHASDAPSSKEMIDPPERTSGIKRPKMPAPKLPESPDIPLPENWRGRFPNCR